MPRLPTAILVALVLFTLVSATLFRTSLYERVLAPASSAGSFERAIAVLARRDENPSSEVLVLGDSRIYEGLLPRVATAATGGRLTFVRAAVPGATPRCWPFLAARIDPRLDRYRALVIPIDALADDDSAIGSVDNDEREMDLHYLVYALEPRDVVRVAASFDSPGARLRTAVDLALRGPLLRDDLRDLLVDPARRLHELADAEALGWQESATIAIAPSLAGLARGSTPGTLSFPAGVSPAERAEIAHQVLLDPRPSPAYARYRREWLVPLVRAYRAAGRPVVLVRIPTRPIPLASGAGRPGDGISRMIADGARLLDPGPYLALERPEFFSDHDHLDLAGARRFSALLGRDVARVVAP